MSVEGRENSRKNHPPAGAAQRFHTASQPPQSSQRAAEAAKRPPQPHFGSCRSHLTPAWLSDYNLLQYEISLRGGDGARTSLGSVPNFFCPAPAMRAPNSFDATPSFIGPAQTCSRAAPISLCQTPTSLGAAPTSPRDAKISLREAISSSGSARRRPLWTAHRCRPLGAAPAPPRALSARAIQKAKPNN